jgi:hypothetical protein
MQFGDGYYSIATDIFGSNGNSSMGRHIARIRDEKYAQNFNVKTT